MLLHGFHYLFDVETVVVVVVHEAEPLHDLVLIAEIHPQWRVLGYSRKENQFLRVGVPLVPFLEDRLERIVPDCREQQGLYGTLSVRPRAGLEVIVLETERLRPLDLLPVLKIGRTLRHDDDVGVVKPLGQIPEPSERKELILVGRAVVVHQNDVEVRPQRPVLERVVQNDQIRRRDRRAGTFAGPPLGLQLLRMAENVASLDPLTVHGHGDAGKLSLYLERFVAIFLDLPVLLDQLEAAAVALVSPRQDSDVAERPVIAPQQGAQDHLGVRSLACAARRDVADADGRYLTGADFEDAVVVASVPQLQRQIIWCKKNLVKHRLQRYKKS